MNEWLWGGVSLFAGGLIGLFYFGGLWWTVQRVATARSPGILILTSFVARTAVAVLALYLVMGGDWRRLLVALAGFILARFILIRRWGPKEL